MTFELIFLNSKNLWRFSKLIQHSKIFIAPLNAAKVRICLLYCWPPKALGFCRTIHQKNSEWDGCQSKDISYQSDCLTNYHTRAIRWLSGSKATHWEIMLNAFFWFLFDNLRGRKIIFEHKLFHLLPRYTKCIKVQ